MTCRQRSQTEMQQTGTGIALTEKAGDTIVLQVK
jgi:hypothetical protein